MEISPIWHCVLHLGEPLWLSGRIPARWCSIFRRCVRNKTILFFLSEETSNDSFLLRKFPSTESLLFFTLFHSWKCDDSLSNHFFRSSSTCHDHCFFFIFFFLLFSRHNYFFPFPFFFFFFFFARQSSGWDIHILSFFGRKL